MDRNPRSPIRKFWNCDLHPCQLEAQLAYLAQAAMGTLRRKQPGYTLSQPVLSPNALVSTPARFSRLA